MNISNGAIPGRVSKPHPPSVSIVVPCYNYAHYLPGCVHSVLTQEGVDVRVLIIDDSSPDDTERVGRALAASDSRVEFHRHAVNRGHIATYNEGLDKVDGEYVVLLSADDLLTPGALRRATDIMAAHPGVGLVYGYPKPVYGQDLPPVRTRITGWTVWEGGKWIELMCRAGRNFINCPEVVMRTRVQRQIGGYRPGLPHSADMEMWLRAAAVSGVGRVNGADQAYYRIHPSSMQRTIHAGFLTDLQGRRDAFLSAFEGEAGRLPGAGEWLALAKRSLATAAVIYACQACGDGRADGEPVEEYREFARSLFPDIAATWRWRMLERHRRRRGVVAATLDYCHAKFIEGMEHLAWYHWRRTGIWQNIFL